MVKVKALAPSCHEGRRVRRGIIDFQVHGSRTNPRKPPPWYSSFVHSFLVTLGRPTRNKNLPPNDPPNSSGGPTAGAHCFAEEHPNSPEPGDMMAVSDFLMSSLVPVNTRSSMAHGPFFSNGVFSVGVHPCSPSFGDDID